MLLAEILQHYVFSVLSRVYTFRNMRLLPQFTNILFPQKRKTLVWPISKVEFDQKSFIMCTKVKGYLLMLSARVRVCWDSNPEPIIQVLLGLTCKWDYLENRMRTGDYPHLRFCVSIPVWSLLILFCSSPKALGWDSSTQEASSRMTRPWLDELVYSRRSCVSESDKWVGVPSLCSAPSELWHKHGDRF